MNGEIIDALWKLCHTDSTTDKSVAWKWIKHSRKVLVLKMKARAIDHIH